MDQLKAGGWESLSPKSVATRLNCSTQPIFSQFSNMPALRKAVMDRAWTLLTGHVSRVYTGDIWVDQSVGYIIFARDNGRLFSCMHYGAPGDIRERREHFWQSVSTPLETYPAFEGLTAEQIGWIRHIRSLLTHGIATAVSTGIAKIWNNDELVEQVLLMCSEVLVEGFSKREAQLKVMSKLVATETTRKIRTLKGR